MSETTAITAEAMGQAPAAARLPGRALAVRIGLITALMAAIFWPTLQWLWLKTNPFTGDPNWAHSFFVPLIGLYYLYLNREKMLAGRPHEASSMRRRALGAWVMLQVGWWGIAACVWGYFPRTFLRTEWLAAVVGLLLALGGLSAAGLWMASGRSGAGALRRMLLRLAGSSAGWFGIYIMLWGMILFAWGISPGRNWFLRDMGMVVSLFGVVLLVCGWGVMRVAWFPIVFLAAAVPWPELFYSKLAMPLQKGAAVAAVATLQMTQVDASREGTIIVIRHANRPPRQLNVEEQCAGLKALMTFIALGASIAFVFSSSRQMWQRVAITLSAVPIAIFANMLRVAGQGLLDFYVSAKLSESFAHQFVGTVLLVPALLMMLLVAWVVDRMVVEEVEQTADAPARPKNAELIIEAPRPRRAAASGEAITVPAGHGDEQSMAARRLGALRRPGAPAEGAASGAGGEQK